MEYKDNICRIMKDSAALKIANVIKLSDLRPDTAYLALNAIRPIGLRRLADYEKTVNNAADHSTAAVLHY